jgi:APA family basic amino acid/polyamine antiporter
MIVGGEFTGNWFNLPALLIMVGLTVLLVRGVKESANTNNVMVIVKVAAILVFLFAAGKHVNPANYTPFMPNGFPGVITGAAIVFFAYIGFDSVSTAAEETRRPQRDMPFGILMTLFVCTALVRQCGLGPDRRGELEDARQRRPRRDRPPRPRL